MSIFDSLCTFIGKFVFYLVFSYLLFYTIGYIIRTFVKKKKSFKNKIVLVTGGANGLGKVISRKFREMGSIVVIWDVDVKGGEKTVEELKEIDSECEVIFQKVDLSKYEMIHKAATELRERVGDVEVLINNAGIVGKANIFDISKRFAELVMDVNVRSHFWMVKEFCPSMIEKNSGHVVCVSSAAGLVGAAGQQVYGASKWACFGFTESLRLQFKKENRNIDTMIVAPTYLSTPMFEGVKTMPFFPLLDPEWVATKIVDGMKEGKTELMLPWYLRIVVYTTRLFFFEYNDAVQHALKVTHSMDDVIENAKKKT